MALKLAVLILGIVTLVLHYSSGEIKTVDLTHGFHKGMMIPANWNRSFVFQRVRLIRLDGTDTW